MLTKINKILILFFPINIFLVSIFSGIAAAETERLSQNNDFKIDKSYLKRSKTTDDYILDTGDLLSIEFIKTPELSGTFKININGEIYLPRLKETYVKGLTIKELKNLLSESYERFLIEPEIYINISKFKIVQFSIIGEVKNPGLYKLDPNYNEEKEKINFDDLQPKLAKVSDAIYQAGGLTPYSDISKIEIIRKIPISKGGGAQKAIVSLEGYFFNPLTSQNINIYNGDKIFIPRLKEKDQKILSESIVSGLTPRFINVSITGLVDNPGEYKIPFNGTLSDLISLSGPRKALSGKIFLIRYSGEGNLLRRKIKFNPNASPGSINNPYLKSGDMLSIKNTIYGRSAKYIKAITEPFLGIYTTKELIESFD